MAYVPKNHPTGPAAPKRRNANHETQLQVRCIRWFRFQYPNLVRLLYAIPNQGTRDKREASILKTAGVTPGLPDLHLAVARSGYHSLYVELKVGDNGLSDHQKAQIQVLQAEGHLVRVVRDIDEFMALINTYLAGGQLAQIDIADIAKGTKIMKPKYPKSSQQQVFPTNS